MVLILIYKDQKGKSLFRCVIDNYGDIDRYKVMELLLDKGVDPNTQDDQGRTPLHYVCDKYYKKGSVEIAKLLLRRGANPDLKDKDGKKSVNYAYNNSDIGKLFGAINCEKAAILGIATLLTTEGVV